MVRSTHGVNCTGGCSWHVYVKYGIVVWETQCTDYPHSGVLSYAFNYYGPTGSQRDTMIVVRKAEEMRYED